MTSTVDDPHTRRLVIQKWDKTEELPAEMLLRIWSYRQTGIVSALDGTELGWIRNLIVTGEEEKI